MRREQLNNHKGNLDLAENKIKEKNDNCQRVYDIIAIFGNITTKHIKKILDNWTNKANESVMVNAKMKRENRWNEWTDEDMNNYYEKNK